MIWLSPVLAKPAARATKENSGQHDMHMLRKELHMGTAEQRSDKTVLNRKG